MCSSDLTVADEIAVADAHPLGARPFGRDQYVGKFRTLADGVLSERAQQRFLDLATGLVDLTPAELAGLSLPGIEQAGETPATTGIF